MSDEFRGYAPQEQQHPESVNNEWSAPARPLDDPAENAMHQAAAPNERVVNTQSARGRVGLNKCPKCGSTDIEYRIDLSALVCHFCHNTWQEALLEPEIAQAGDISTLRGTTVASGAADIVEGAEDIVTVKCGGCGAEVVIPTNETVSARCHWCRQNLSLGTQVPNGAVPDAILPFSVPHDVAVEKIRKFAGSRRMFAHSKFKREFKPENMVGVYLPYMVVDANASAMVHGEGEIRTRTYKSGDNTRYDADVYEVRREVNFAVDDLTVESRVERANFDAEVNTNNIINTILPFDTKNAVKWSPHYLNGITSEKRDKNIEDIRPRVERQLLSISRSLVQPSTDAYTRGVRWEQEALAVHGTRWVSMYLPVWLYSYYHIENGIGMVHYIAVNGRTGETMGSVPVSKAKLLGLAVPVGVITEIFAIGIVAAYFGLWFW